eukprot:353298_1
MIQYKLQRKSLLKHTFLMVSSKPIVEFDTNVINYGLMKQNERRGPHVHPIRRKRKKGIRWRMKEKFISENANDYILKFECLSNILKKQSVMRNMIQTKMKFIG